jgi:hypothetical protein
VIRTVGEPFQGYRQTSDCAYWADALGLPIRRLLGEIEVKVQIARPGVYETLAPDSPSAITGAAWSGEAKVTGVSVRSDGGATWSQAEFINPPDQHTWRRWKLDWRAPTAPGRYTLLARATDAKGRIQPDGRDPNYGTYAINHPIPIELFVDDRGS